MGEKKSKRARAAHLSPLRRSFFETSKRPMSCSPSSKPKVYSSTRSSRHTRPSPSCELSHQSEAFPSHPPQGWRADGRAFPTHERAAGDGDESMEVDEQKVLSLLAERSIARRDRVPPPSPLKPTHPIPCPVLSLLAQPQPPPCQPSPSPVASPSSAAAPTTTPLHP